VGGVLAALPVLASILAVFTHARFGAAAVVDLLRGMLGGMAAFVGFCALAGALVEPLGIAASFAAATLAAVAIQLAAARMARPPRRRSRAAPAAPAGSASPAAPLAEPVGSAPPARPAAEPAPARA